MIVANYFILAVSYQRKLVSSVPILLDATSLSFSRLFASSQEKLASGMTRTKSW